MYFEWFRYILLLISQYTYFWRIMVYFCTKISFELRYSLQSQKFLIAKIYRERIVVVSILLYPISITFSSKKSADSTIDRTCLNTFQVYTKNRVWLRDFILGTPACVLARVHQVASGIFCIVRDVHRGWNVELYVTRVPCEWMVRGPSRSIAIRMILGGCGKHEQKSIVPRYL